MQNLVYLTIEQGWPTVLYKKPKLIEAITEREPPFLRWNAPYPLLTLALIFLFLAKVRLSLTLTLYPLTIRCSGLTALFLFLLAKAALGCLQSALSVALRPLFPFLQTQFAQVSLLKLAQFCKLFAGLGSINKSAISLLLLSDSRPFLTTLSSPSSFLLPQSLCQIWQEPSSLSFCSIRLQWVPGHSFLPGIDAADELARWGALITRSAIPCSLSSLISRIHSSFFSDWRHTVSSKFFDTQVPSISTEELVFPRHARCALSLSSMLQWTQPSIKLLSLQIWQNRESFLQHLQTLVPEHLSFHSALSSYGLLAPLALWRLFVSLRFWSRPWRVARTLELHGLPPSPIPRKGSGNNNITERAVTRPLLQTCAHSVRAEGVDLFLEITLHNTDASSYRLRDDQFFFQRSFSKSILPLYDLSLATESNMPTRLTHH